MRNTLRILVCLLASTFLLTLVSPALAQEQPGEPNEMININTATVEELTQLKRIGPSYAQRIVDYREQNGLFKASEDIMLVKGIGQRTWEANMDNITVGASVAEKKQ